MLIYFKPLKLEALREGDGELHCIIWAAGWGGAGFCLCLLFKKKLYIYRSPQGGDKPQMCGLGEHSLFPQCYQRKKFL